MKDELGNYSAKKDLLKSFRDNERLTALVEGGFFNLIADQDAGFPRVVYTQTRNVPTEYADNKEIQAVVAFQVSIYTDEFTNYKETEIEQIMDHIMGRNKYKKYDSDELYEQDTKIYHKVIFYDKNFSIKGDK